MEVIRCINTKLLINWTACQLYTNIILYPVSECIVSRWMKDAGFKYEKYKKLYYMDQDDDEDVVSDRKTYVGVFLRMRYTNTARSNSRRSSISL